MTQIIAVNSFLHGIGRSNLTANITTLLAAEGRRIGVIDIDARAPTIHFLFGLEEADIPYSLNDYLLGECRIEQAALDVTPRLGPNIKGQVFLIPSSKRASEVVHVLHEGYTVDRLNGAFQTLIEALKLDVFMIDTHAGLSEDSLLSMAISDALVVVLRLDKQDYQGTSVMVEVARKLEVPRIMLVVNRVPSLFDETSVKARVETIYGCEVAAVLPESEEMMALESAGIFVQHYPNHILTTKLKQVAAKLMTHHPPHPGG